MKRSLVVLVAASLVFAGVASAAVQKGETEINLAGSFVSTNGANNAAANGNKSANDSTLWSVNGFFGYFLTDNIEVGLGANGEWTRYGSDASVGGEQHRSLYGIGPVVKYNFMPTNLWVPYIGAQAQWEWSDDQGGLRTSASGWKDGLMYGPLAGVRFELNANNDFFVEYQYRLFAGELDDLYDSSSAVLIGIAHQFK
jgi:outer membrane protein W